MQPLSVQKLFLSILQKCHNCMPLTFCLTKEQIPEMTPTCSETRVTPSKVDCSELYDRDGGKPGIKPEKIGDHADILYSSKMSHPCCVCINNRCRYQSITHYLKICLIKDDSNYMFRPIAAIIRFSSESMVVVLYRIGMVMSRW